MKSTKDRPDRRGRLVVISGPSGVGKSTVCDKIMESPGFRRLVTCTTRPLRNGERDGVDYHFLGDEEFKEKVSSGGFLEYAEVHGHLYGTPRDQVLDAIERGETLLLNVDVQGARAIREAGIQKLTTVFVEPPSMEELERRLAKRASETGEEMERRLMTARRELEEKPNYNHVVVNDDLDNTVQAILEILGHTVAARRSFGAKTANGRKQ